MSEMGRLSSWLDRPDNTGFSGENFFEQPMAVRISRDIPINRKSNRGYTENIP
jgi:hypothetical protein